MLCCAWRIGPSIRGARGIMRTGPGGFVGVARGAREDADAR